MKCKLKTRAITRSPSRTAVIPHNFNFNQFSKSFNKLVYCFIAAGLILNL